MYDGTRKHRATSSTDHLSCSINCASAAEMVSGSHFIPSPSTAVRPIWPPLKFVSHSVLRRVARSGEIFPGAVSTPEARLMFAKNENEFCWIVCPVMAETPAAYNGVNPQSG